MTGTLKKGVLLLVLLFVGYLLFTDPNGLAGMAEDGGSKLWDMLVGLFEAVIDFINALGD